jgi:ubiquinone/menaquinone biosynthesis C-methylase UbiE
MGEHETGQVAASAAEIYEAFFIPALFIDWPDQVLTAADVGAGHHVLDIACGTGILARHAEAMVGPNGSVTGVDINEGMLAVARKMNPNITWELGAAESLPYDPKSFDRVVSQFGLMFFSDPVQAISEMVRVVRPGGKIGVAVWASLEDTPGYAAIAKLLKELFGPEVAKSMEAPYSLGDIQQLRTLFQTGGANEVTIETVPGKARFDSVESWIYTDIRGWTLAEVIDDEGYERLKREAPKKLSQFVLADGSVEFDAPAHIVTVAA